MKQIYSLGTILLITLPFTTINLWADQLTYDPFAKEKKAEVIIEVPVTTSRPVEKVVEEKWEGKLLSIIEAGTDSIANVDGNFIALGESYKNYTLIKVNKTSVVFEHGNHEIKLELEE